jgi:hypothetical protein
MDETNLPCHFIQHCNLNLFKDMVEDNPLYLENVKETQDNDEKQIRWQGI